MKRLILCLVLSLPLTVASRAAAKEVVSAKVCGASDCRQVKDEKSLMALHEGGAPTDPPKSASAFYHAELTVRGDGENFKFAIVLVPEAGLLRGTNDDGSFTWMPVSDSAVAQYRRMTHGLEPIPAAKLEGLDAPALPQARVDEVVEIARDAPAASSDAAPLWPWIAGGLAGLAALALVVVPRLRPAGG